jgi:cytidylate kinase
VTDAIREPRIDRAVPAVARQTPIREVMRRRQRELADEGDAVIEGRDIGRVVVPDAEVKVYLVADVQERARRRTADRPGLGQDVLVTDLRLRDESDAAQMERADDAEEIDTTTLGIDEVVDHIEALVTRARAAA